MTGIAADVLVQHVDLSTVIVSLLEQGIVFFVIDNRINVALSHELRQGLALVGILKKQCLNLLNPS